MSKPSNNLQHGVPPHMQSIPASRKPTKRSKLRRIHSQFNWLMHFRLHSLPYMSKSIDHDIKVSDRAIQLANEANYYTAELKEELELCKQRAIKAEKLRLYQEALNEEVYK